MPKLAPSNTHPALGTVIDDGQLQLVEVLGVGGYGVVYRAVPVGLSHSQSHSYAVKCLYHGSSTSNTSRRRQIHLREIMLHRLASAHPNVVTLHKVVEEERYTYIVLDYAPSADLFTQILNGRQYLGSDEAIRHVFLQLLDAMEYCPFVGDLPPRLEAREHFGLATTDKMSMEWRTGSIYHMSPECQAGSSSYSPAANDVWSLGVILINLITGRNPFRSSSLSDPTFQCYVQNPAGFLPTVLPLSRQVNRLLVRMLALDWRQRPSIVEVRTLLESVATFYAPGVIFEGSMARCPWEAPMEVDSEEDEEEVDSIGVEQPTAAEKPEDIQSHWSQESIEEVPAVADDRLQSWSPTYVNETTSSMAQRTPCSASSSSSSSSSSDSDFSPSPSQDAVPWPVTPDSRMTSFVEHGLSGKGPLGRLTIDTSGLPRRSRSESSSMLFTAVDELSPASASFFAFTAGVVTAAAGEEKSNRMSGIEVVDRDEEMLSPTSWAALDVQTPVAHPPSPFIYSEYSSSSATTLSSFNAACPSTSVSTLSSQDSFYMTSRREQRGGQPFTPVYADQPTVTSPSPSSFSDRDTVFVTTPRQQRPPHYKKWTEPLRQARIFLLHPWTFLSIRGQVHYSLSLLFDSV
ncbi:kinase-like domain-containing protein [Flagelloscypha sp. PMI_526]|nr:kinase-like domain-containing protein [Flagelloscypha sp. PMI_526]